MKPQLPLIVHEWDAEDVYWHGGESGISPVLRNGNYVIHILVSIGPNGKDYAEHLRQIAGALCSSKTVLKWWSVTEDGHAQPDGFQNLGIIKKNRRDPEGRFSKHAGMIHGSAITLGIDKLRKHISPNDYILISDADIVILHKDWDILFINKLKNPISIIGIPYNEGERPSQRDKSSYGGYPCAVFMMFPASLLSDDRIIFDFRPNLSKRGGLTSIRLHKKPALKRLMDYGKVIFSPRRLNLDVGWHFAISLKQAGHQSVILNRIQNGQYHIPPKLRAGIIEYNLDKIVHVIHYVSSRDRPFHMPRILIFNENLDKYLKEKFGL